jgi:hypothetical protein
VAAPTGMTATLVSNHEIDLSLTNNATDADGIVIEKSVDGGTTWTGPNILPSARRPAP